MIPSTIRGGLVSISLLFSSAVTAAAKEKYTFGIIPKSISNSFFFPVREGCQARSAFHGHVECEWVGTEMEDPTGLDQARLIDELVDMRLNGTKVLDGLAISVINGDPLVEPIRRALDSGMSVICFDSDAAQSDRQAYVGTNNIAFGEQLGKVLLQLRPMGGNYAILTVPGENLILRVQGIRQSLEGTTWTELPKSLTFEENGRTDFALKQIEDLKGENPSLNAIIPSYGGPMKEAKNWTQFVDDNRDLSFVVADAMPNQVQLMERGYADGLVGQLPYQSGELCIDTLLQLQESGNPPKDPNNDLIYGTNLSFLMRIPLELPELTVDMNYLGSLVILGGILFAMLALLILAFTAWVFKHAEARIVRASQPFFLVIISVGSLVMSASIIPMSIDDNKFDQRAVNIACNATHWLFSIGFCLVFAGLYSKLHRIHRLTQAGQRFSKEKVTVLDVMPPFVCMTGLNLIVLICWSTIAPMEYVRTDHEGTDPWNRVVATYGRCVSSTDQSSLPFSVSLGIINLGALIVANIQAYKTRHVQTEYSESKYIALSLISMTQGWAIGLPVLSLVEEVPQVNYLVRVLLVFVINAALLLFIFLPKVMYYRRNGNGRPARQSVRRFSQVHIKEGVNQTSNTVASIRRMAEVEEQRAKQHATLSSTSSTRFSSTLSIVEEPDEDMLGDRDPTKEAEESSTAE